MEFHPTFSKENDQNHPYQDPSNLNSISKAFLKVLTSYFCLLKRISYFYWPAESEKTDIILTKFWWSFTPFFQKNDQNHPNQDPRALNPNSKAFLKALTSILLLLKWVSYFYWLAESEKTDIIFIKFWWIFTPLFPKKMTRITHNKNPVP